MHGQKNIKFRNFNENYSSLYYFITMPTNNISVTSHINDCLVNPNANIF